MQMPSIVQFTNVEHQLQLRRRGHFVDQDPGSVWSQWPMCPRDHPSVISCSIIRPPIASFGVLAIALVMVAVKGWWHSSLPWWCYIYIHLCHWFCALRSCLMMQPLYRYLLTLVGLVIPHAAQDRPTSWMRLYEEWAWETACSTNFLRIY